MPVPAPAPAPAQPSITPVLTPPRCLWRMHYCVAADDVSWEPTRDFGLGPRATCAVAPLLTLSLQLLASHIDAVESLVGMPDAVRSQLAAAVCARRSMSPAAALMFAQGHPTELVLPSCVQLDAAAMSALIAQLLPDSHDGKSAAGQPRLERLELGHCGRGFGDEAATQLASAGPLVGLRLLRLGGAYRLGDAAAAAVVGACPDLVELALPSAPRLTGACKSFFLGGEVCVCVCLFVSMCDGYCMVR